MNIAGLPLWHSYTYQPAAISEPQPASTASASTHSPPPASATQQKKSSRPPRNNNKFKRFRNAFIYYVNDQRQVGSPDQVEEDVKHLKNREFLQLMSARWKSLPREQREPFVQMAEEDKRRYNEDVKKFGKYESRQRKGVKGVVMDRATLHGTAPYTVPSAPQLGALASAPYLLPPTYGVVPATPPASADAWQTNPHYLAMLNTAGAAPPHPVHQDAASSNASVASFDGLHMPLSAADGHFPWARLGIPSNAAMRTAAAVNRMQSRMPMVDKLHAATLLRQPMSPGFMPIPSGAPVMHALTEPAIYDGGHAGTTPNLQLLQQQHLQ
ncbi:hypothetical protein H4R19_003706 [Coemansia spiralis]|nr:hypothetical protein H4R19_003706 [Coemansia spiralis]